jgi:hypothetical protein
LQAQAQEQKHDRRTGQPDEHGQDGQCGLLLEQPDTAGKSQNE